MIANNGRTVSLKLTRREVCKVLLLCDAMTAENNEWNEIGEKIREQLNAFDSKAEKAGGE